MSISKKYKYAVIAADVVIFTIREQKLQVLLIKMKKQPFTGKWAVPGGLVRPEESLAAAAFRQLKTKTGVSDVYLEQLYTFGEVNRDPFGRVVSTAYFALIPAANVRLQTTEEYADVGWFPVKELPKLAYDHRRMVKLAVERLRGKLSYTAIAAALLPKEFTLTHLQQVYEVILGKRLDKRNFRKKILAVGLAKKTGDKETGAANRPADLHRFTKKAGEQVDILT